MNITYFRVFLGILGHYSIQYLNFAKKLFNSVFNLKFWRKFNSKKYSIQKFARKFNSKKYSIKKIQFKKIFNSKICKKIQFKIWFKILNLAGFNSTIYSFNNKTWVSLTPKPPTADRNYRKLIQHIFNRRKVDSLFNSNVQFTVLYEVVWRTD